MTSAPAEKKRVLYVVDKSGFGGVQSIAYALMRQQVPDVEMSFLFLRNLNARFGMADSTRPNVYYARSRGRFGVASFFDLLRLVREKRIDILHLNGNKAVLFGPPAKLLVPRLAILAHDHGGVFDYKPWYALFLRIFHRWFDLYLGVSSLRKRFLQERCAVDPGKIRVVNNFVDPARFPSPEADVPSFDVAAGGTGSFVVGYVGGLSHIKGCDVLLRAVPRLREKIPGLQVRIAGDGPARGELEGLTNSLGIGDIVTFLGYVSEPVSAYAGFDLLVIPSRAEEGPICLYEAWMMRVPVVASNAPVLDERIQDRKTGLLFASEDSADLAAKIVEVRSNRELRGVLVTEGRKAVQSLTVDNYVATLRDIYFSLSGKD